MDDVELFTAEPKKRGRPAKAAEPVKKGNVSWKPAGSRLHVKNPEPGYTYKWFSVAGDDQNYGDRIEVAREEGWEVVSNVTGSKVEAGEGSISTVRRVGTLRLMKTPIENKEARDAYFRNQTDKQTMRPATRARQMLDETGGPYDPGHVISDQVTRNTRYPTRARGR